MYRALIYREGASGFTVWLVSTASGSKIECIGHFNSKRQALKVARTYNREAK